MDIMGVTLRHACSARLYQDEFEKQEFRRSRLEVSAIRSTYLFELILFMAGMTVITVNQNMGEYQCQDVKVDFGDGIWEDPYVVIDGTTMKGFTLVFSYFNGMCISFSVCSSDFRENLTLLPLFIQVCTGS